MNGTASDEGKWWSRRGGTTPPSGRDPSTAGRPPAGSPTAGSPAAGSPTAGSPTAGPPPRREPKPPSKGKLRAEALERARRERRGRDTTNRLRLLGLRDVWLHPDPPGGPTASPNAGGAAPPGAPGRYSDLPGGPAPPDDDPRPARNRTGWRRALGLRGNVFLAAAIIALVVIVTQLHSNSGPALTTSCTTPGLAISPSSVKAQGVVRYAVTGPAGQTFAVAVDAVAVSRTAAGKYAALGAAPGAQSQAVGLSTLRTCRTSGAFAIQLPAGTHRVTMFRVVNGRSTIVASQPLTVTPS